MIAAVTNYYNPSNRQRKRDNLDRMMSGLKDIPLYVIEAAFGDDQFTLPEDDRTIRVRSPHYIWQQYRLVNLVIQRLPDRFDRAVWIDADILFDDPDWHRKMADMLDSYKIVQSYGEVELLGDNGKPVEVKMSVTKKAAINARKPEATTLASCLNMAAAYATGFSWGVRREVIEKHGVYDYWITGSSDNAFVLGIWGDWQNQFIRDRLNEPMRRHFMDWAVPFNAYVGGSVSYLEGTIKHLWHGHRNYKKRWRCLKDFDPASDIRIGEGGVFEWCSEKPDMHECCRSMCLNYDIEFSPYL